MLAVMGSGLERKMFGVFLRDHIDNQTFRQMSGVKNILVVTRENEVRWARDVARLADNR